VTPEQLEQIVDMLAEKLGPMAEVVWEAYIRQATLTATRWGVAAVMLGILTVVSLGFLVWFIVGTIRECRRASGSPSCEECNKNIDGFYPSSALIDGFVFVGLLMTAVWVGIEAYMRLNNPAFYAIQMLLGR